MKRERERERGGEGGREGESGYGNERGRKRAAGVTRSPFILHPRVRSQFRFLRRADAALLAAVSSPERCQPLVSIRRESFATATDCRGSYAGCPANINGSAPLTRRD